jgi:polysaccharide pyruvyl transferase WcaK-like protein
VKILVDTSNYFLDNQNYGDIAMFCMLSRRLHALWPAAEINFITLDPQLIAQHVPGVRPMTLSKRHHWQLLPPGELSPQRAPWRWQRRLLRWRSLAHIHQHLPHYAALAADTPDVDRFIELFRSTRLVMASGGGYFSDMFPEHACGLLDTLAGAEHFGVATAIMGAGFEEVRNPELRAKAAAVLPRVDFIGCREGLHAPSILQSFGVSPRQIHVVGDEAIAIAHEARPSHLGSGIGVNLRQAEYSGVSHDLVAAIAPVLAAMSKRYSAPLLPIPISMFGPSDCESIRGLISPHNPNTDGGATLDTLAKLLAQVSHCRIVVTGSYHAAVFALSQGISTIGLARSLHYSTKLGGLRAEFGDGCTMVPLDSPNLPAELAAAINAAWQSADSHRPRLLESARNQIATCDAAYRRLRRIAG